MSFYSVYHIHSSLLLQRKIANSLKGIFTDVLASQEVGSKLLDLAIPHMNF